MMMDMQKMRCPRCGKRLLDIKTDSEEEVIIETRCPNCGRMVKVYWKPQKDK